MHIEDRVQTRAEDEKKATKLAVRMNYNDSSKLHDHFDYRSSQIGFHR